MDVHEATCSCGAVGLKVQGAPQLVSSCACQACQRRTGAAFGVQAFFLQNQIVEEAGEPGRYVRTADSGAVVEHSYCRDCGTTLSWTTTSRPGIVTVASGCFADKAFPPPPSRMVWTDFKPDWLEPPAGAAPFPRAPA